MSSKKSDLSESIVRYIKRKARRKFSPENEELKQLAAGLMLKNRVLKILSRFGVRINLFMK